MAGRNWACECPLLNQFVDKVHEFFEDSERRRYLMQQIANVIEATQATKRGDADWHRRRRAYFEHTAMENAALLDDGRPIAGLIWQEYERYVPIDEATDLTTSLRERLDCLVDSEGRLGPALYSAGHLLKVTAWGPSEFLACHHPRPQFPLPPVDIGRDYRVDEICLALVALHDAHGRYEPLIRDDNAVRHDQAWTLLWKHAAEYANDGWVVLLQPQWRRLKAALAEEKSGEPVTATMTGLAQSAVIPRCSTVHSPDFRSVLWHCHEYSFTASQALVVALLWRAWEQGTPDVGDETLLAAVDHEAPPSSLRNLFRGHTAWNEMIVPGASRGSHRLDRPINR